MDTKRRSRLFWGALLLGLACLAIFIVSPLRLYFGFTSIVERFQFYAVERDEREIWRNPEFSSVNRFVVSGDVLMLEGYKDNDCICVYAYNKYTGEKLWNTEKLAIPHIENYKGEKPLSLRTNGWVEIVRLDEERGEVLIEINFESIYALNILNGEVIWSADFEYPGWALSDKHVFVSNEDFSLDALNRSSMQRVWTIPDFISSRDDTYIYFDEDRKVLVVTTYLEIGKTVQFYDPTTGDMLEEIVDTSFPSADAIYEGDIFSFRLSDNGEGSTLSSVDEDTGKRNWEINFVNPPHRLHPAEFQKGLLFILLDSLLQERSYNQGAGEILAMKPDTGEIVWHFNKNYQLGSLYSILGTDHILVSSERGTILALDLMTGETLWRTVLATGAHDYFVFDDYYVIATKLNHIYAIEKTEGDILWHYHNPIEITEASLRKTPTWRLDADIKLMDGFILISTDEPYLGAIELSSGTELWSWSHGKVPGEYFDDRHEIELVTDDLLFVSQNGDIFVFDVSDMK